MELVLFEPEIPPNTGNVARLCAAAGVRLHLVEPLGFSIDDKHLKRAGLDYWPHVDVRVWPDMAALEAHMQGRRLVCSSSRKGHDGQRHDRFPWRADDVIVLGPETRGLPAELIARHPCCVRIPIRDTVRSLNMSTAAGILLYTALSATDTLPE